jgi:hypothetical protein
MKIIEGLKKTKELQKKLDDIKSKVSNYCSYPSFETAVYGSADAQTRQISEWVQSYSDILKEILRLRIAIQKTNIETKVDIELGGIKVTKTIAEWIHRRRDLAVSESSIWQSLTDRNLKEGKFRKTTGEEMELTIIRCYNPVEKDKRLNVLQTEPIVIDGRLEVINAITDLIE